jgi:hypothetical protein
MKPKIQVYYRISVRDDKTGKIVKKGRLRKSKSFVIAFLQIMSSEMMADTPSIKDTGGTNRVVTAGQSLATNGAINSVAAGTIVGTGTTAPTNTDNKIGTLIVPGSGSGQLNYGAQSDVAAQVVGANVDYTQTRTFQNLSGATITITEIAMYGTYSTFTFCIIRDLATQAVLNNQTATVTYTLRTTA